MTGFLSLSPNDRESNPQVGDLVGVEILIDEKVGSPTDEWKIKSPEGVKWISSGSLTISTSLRPQEAEGNTTKLGADALVHQAGTLNTEELTLVHIPSGREVTVLVGNLGKEIEQVAEEESAPPPPWTLPPIPFGGWNIFLIVLLSALLLAALYLAFRKYGQKLPGRRKRNHKDSALQALQGLQKFARSKKILQQEEWKKFSFDLANIIRKYSDENFRIDSSDMTDREFLAELRMQPKAKALVDSISNILSTIDEVRYGKKGLEATAVPSLLLESRKFVEQTFQPREEGKK